jgi:hypothetical protein
MWRSALAAVQRVDAGAIARATPVTDDPLRIAENIRTARIEALRAG